MNMSTDTTDGSSGTSISIFGQAQGINDFPVLKAFQEYIDAEQSKARKRMLGLSVFFLVLLGIVVVTFTLIVIGVINRNQALSDRLLEFALHQQNKSVVQQTATPPVAVVQPPIPQPQLAQSDLKPVLDKIERLATVLAEQPRNVQPQQSVPSQSIAAATPAATIPASAAVQTSQPSNIETKAKAEIERLREHLKREREMLDSERKKLKDEQRKAEVERHRRRLYPEYYARKDTETKSNIGDATQANSPSQHAAGSQQLESMRPVGYFNREKQAEDTELAELTRQAERRMAQAEAAKRKAEVESAEADARKAQSEAARRQAEADAAEAARRQAEADATAAKQRKLEESAIKPDRPAAKPVVKTETINVGSRDGGNVPWIIQRLEER